MDFDVTPLIAKEKKVIDGYGAGYFTINSEKIEHHLVLMPDSAEEWTVTDASALKESDFSSILEKAEDIEILLVGTGEKLVFLPHELEELLKKQGIVADVMDTGAACRTYNVLLSEERAVAAALLTL